MNQRFYQSPLRRFTRHLYYEVRGVSAIFSRESLTRIEAAVSTSELTHTAEVRVAIEASLTLHELFSKKTPRDRALEAFSLLKIWDTAQNNGVLIYINVADRAVEIIADRGFEGHFTHSYWQQLCSQMVLGFQQDMFEQSVVQCVQTLGKDIAARFPSDGKANPNELSNAPVVL
jgi:uncharacterized membrane protein YgcG